MSRNIEFDREDILDKAMNLFWEKGYQSTSLKDLCETTGLQKGSLYNSFKSKENLFLLCLDKYGRNSKTRFFKNSEDPKIYLKLFFKRLVDQGSNETYTKGCLIMNSCLELASNNTTPAQRTQQLFKDVEDNFKNVLQQIDLTNKDRDNISTLLISAAFSIREISKFKKDRTFLKQIANSALSELNISL